MDSVNSISLEKALVLLEQGALVLTVNNRLTSWLKVRYGLKKQTSVWKTPSIEPLALWIQNQHQQLLINGRYKYRLISELQNKHLWNSIIDKHNTRAKANAYLLRPGACALAAQQSLKLIDAYQLDINELRQYHDSQCNLLLKWINNCQSYLNQHQLIDAGGFTKELITHIEQGVVKLPKTIIISGFDDISPQQESLLLAIQKQGSQLFNIKANETNASLIHYRFPQIEDELKAAALWARDELLANPHQQLAIIVVDLAQQKERLNYWLQKTLHPELTARSEAHPRLLYNISLGSSLADEPMIHDALLLLRFLDKPIPLQNVSRLLFSPFINSHIENHQQQQILHRLNQQESLEITAKEFVHLFTKDQSLEFVSLIGKLLHTKDKSHAQNYSDYAGLFSELLDQTNWTKGSLNSREYQSRIQFEALFDQLSMLDQIHPSSRYGSALNALNQATTEKIFKTQSGGDAPIQVMGILEAAGQSFDQSRIIGMTGENWPPKPAPDPLLPIAIQRKHKMPHSSAECTFSFAKSITSHLKTSAPFVIFSSAEQPQDHSLLASPLLKDIETTSVELQQDTTITPAQTEFYNDHKAPAVTEHEQPKGGSALLNNQAMCPFRAFVLHRLKIAEPQEAEQGLSAKDKGIWIHAALEYIWAQLGRKSALEGLSTDELEQLIDKAIADAFNKNARYSKQNPFIQLEMAREKELLLNWLTLEKQRPNFKIIALEKDHEARIFGLQLKLKIDRIDQLDDQRQILIDYKSAKPFKPDWFSPQPTDLQLPLYAGLIDEPLAAVVLGFVNASGCSFKGVIEDKSLGSGIRQQKTQPLKDLRPLWKQAIEGYADDFMQGKAEVNPVQNACTYCPLPAICRIRKQES